MIKIINEEGLLLLEYLPYNSTHWIKLKIAKNEEIRIVKIFNFLKKDIYKYESIDGSNDSDDDNDSEVIFTIGKLVDDYWLIDKDILKIDYNIYISEDYTISPNDFRSETGLSIFREIFKVIKEDIWIGGNNPKAIDIEIFKALLNRFPTSTELSHYISARTSSVLKEYFTSTIDFEKRYEAYRQKKVRTIDN